jgi:type IV pilus assembly protein PilF
MKKWMSALLISALVMLLSCKQQALDNGNGHPKQDKIVAAAYYNTQLGLAYLNQGNMPRAKRKLLQALALNKTSPDVNAALAYYYEKTKEVNEATAYYKKALDYSHHDGAQLNNYGAFLCRQGQYDKAEQYFLDAVKDMRYLHTAGAFENAGLCALENKQEDKAKVYFTKALSQDRTRVQSLYELVTLALNQQQFLEARKYLETYPMLVSENKSLQALSNKVAERESTSVTGA